MITIIGVGRVGTATALHLALRELDDITLIDIKEGLPQGEALDLNHMCASLGIEIDFCGSNDYKDMASSDLIIVPAGFIRTADMSRLDLLHKNAGVIKTIGNNIAEYAPGAKVIVVTNPLDIMTYLMYRVTGFDRRRVMGFSGLLDTGRFKYFIAKELGVSTSSIQTLVIGEHGDSMVPLPRLTSVGGKPLMELLPKEKINEILEKTRKSGAEVVKLKGWSASHAPGAGIADMAEAIIKDTNAVIPSSVYLDGEYGVRDVCAVVPVVLGKIGVKKIIELELKEEERSAFIKGINVLKSAIAQLKLSSVSQ